MLKNNKIAPGSIGNVASKSSATNCQKSYNQSSLVSSKLDCNMIYLLMINHFVVGESKANDGLSTRNKPIASRDSTNLPSSSPSRSGSIHTHEKTADKSISPDTAETGLSAKLMQFIRKSVTTNSITPSDAASLKEYQQMAVLAAGGVLEASEEEALQERFGLNDVEAGEMEGENGNEVEQERPAEAV